MKFLIQKIAIAAMLVSATLASAQASEQHGHMESSSQSVQQPWGMPGTASEVTQTISMQMSDAMRFAPSKLTIKQGETVRFIEKNNGRVPHEFVIGTPETLQAHRMEMRQGDQQHQDDTGYQVRVAPSKQGEIIWTFNRQGEFEFGCLIPGHYESGMRGIITVTP